MTETKKLLRYRANPVEVVILLAVSGLLAQSAYRLFFDSETFTPNALRPMAANPISEFPRNPASGAAGASTLELKCPTAGTLPQEQEIADTKVRLAGPLCGQEGGVAGNQIAQVTQVSVLNSANQFSATVSLDQGAGRFTTDYLPLASGRNPIRVEYTRTDGTAVTQDLVLSRPQQ